MPMMSRRRGQTIKEEEPIGGTTPSNASPEKSRGSHFSRNPTGCLRVAVIPVGLVLIVIVVVFGMSRIIPSETEKFLGVTRTHGQMVKRAPKQKVKMACVDKAQKA